MRAIADLAPRERLMSAAGVLLLHVALGLALLAGLRVARDVPVPVVTIATFDVPVSPPPPPRADPLATRLPHGAAAPPNRRARAAPVAVPLTPVLVDPRPPVALPDRVDDSLTGAAVHAGPGTGGGGIGSGTGSAGEGNGTGGGSASRALLLRGAIANRDYPRAASRAGATGSVTVRFVVTGEGRATQCRVTVSSGTDALDATTCRLIERRFRYRPATDAAGSPIAEERGWRQDWWLEGRAPD